MSKLQNIQDYPTYITEWKTVKNNNGKFWIDGNHKVTDPDDIDDINQAIKRSLTDDMKKICGGIRRLETDYEKKDIEPIYNSDSDTFSKVISDGDCGYYQIVDNPKVPKLFSMNVSTLGKGEVLMACLFPDVKLCRRKFKDEESDKQTPDCECTDCYIEIKSACSEFIYKEDGEDKIHNYVNSIVDHMKSRCHIDKDTTFVFFDNTRNSNRKGNDDPKGFFWIKCGKKNEENTNELVELLKKNVKIGEVWSRPKSGYFSISCIGENGKNGKIIIHPRTKE